MATVVITFFLFVRFYVCKMDADCIEDQRDQLLSRREKRWSMNSQRLEEIVAELMRPISSDARRHFDTDLSALLEEYLTEAGLHALDAADDAVLVAPNYAELALLLQQSAAIYGRKVDFLYQHVKDVREALHESSSLFDDAAEPAPAEAEPADEAREARTPRSRARAAAADPEVFARAGCVRDARPLTRDAGAPRPHPTLPRVFMELEPRVLSDARHVLRDYAGEPIGLLEDFQATNQLSHSRMLVDDASAGLQDEQSSLRPISLVELQAAIEAAAPPLPEPLSPESPPGSPRSPLRTSTPLPPASPLAALDASAAAASAEPESSAALDASAAAASAEPESSAALDASAAAASAEPDSSAALSTSAELDASAVLSVVVRRERKRQRTAFNIKNIFEGSVKITFNEELRQRLAEAQEFSLPTKWIERIVNKRACHILSERQRRRREEPDPLAEFAGWNAAEIAEASARVKEPESEDDGFYEQSSWSLGGGSPARADSATRAEAAAPAEEAAGLEAQGAAAEAESERACCSARRRPRRAAAWTCARWAAACCARCRRTARRCTCTSCCAARRARTRRCRTCSCPRCSWPTPATCTSCRARRCPSTPSRWSCGTLRSAPTWTGPAPALSSHPAPATERLARAPLTLTSPDDARRRTTSTRRPRCSYSDIYSVVVTS